MTEEHNCLANFHPNRDQMIFNGSEVYVYGTCRECGIELEIEYEYADSQPV